MTKELPFTNKHRSWRNRTIPSKHNDIKIARHYYFMRKCWEIYPAVRPTAKAANETMTEFIGDIKLLIPPQTHCPSFALIPTFSFQFSLYWTPVYLVFLLCLLVNIDSALSG